MELFARCLGIPRRNNARDDISDQQHGHFIGRRLAIAHSRSIPVNVTSHDRILRTSTLLRARYVSWCSERLGESCGLVTQSTALFELMNTITDKLWYEDAVLYQVSVRAFKDSNGDGYGDLHGLTEKLDYIHELGIDCIWLMPIYPSPLRDDGYDIADYYNVAEMYGNLEDLKSLIKAAHDRNIRIIMDLVLNHTSDEHPWFKASRSDKNSPYRDYYVWSDTDQKYKDTRIIFLDTEPSNWTWDEKTGQYYWHRFYASQPDLNFDNPKVQEEMLNIARFWLELGIDGFRADAVPYLFEREGTTCENLPETHLYLKKLRAFIEKNYPDRILLCEANQSPEDVRPYFGDGDEF